MKTPKEEPRGPSRIDGDRAPSLVDGTPFGVLRGASQRGSGMDVVAPYLADPPAKGDFAVVPGDDGALILRIASAYPTGSFAEASDRGAEYLAQLARQPAHGQVPERIRELLLRFRVEVIPLGFLRTEPKWRFEAGVRAIQLFGNPVWRPSRALLGFLVNVGLQDEDESQIVPIGSLARGHEALTDVPVRFSIRRLKGRRTFVFARAGYGKSNLTKLLLSRLYKAPPDVGLLIIDPEGEYPFSQRSETGRVIPGLVDHPDIRPRVRVFSDREPPEGADADVIAGRLRVDVSKLSSSEFITVFVPPEKTSGVWTNYLRSCSRDDWATLISTLRSRRFQVEDHELARILKIRQPAATNKGGDGNNSLNAIRNNVIPALHRLDDPRSQLIELCQKHLFGLGDTKPGVVILDVSTMSSQDADCVVRVVLLSLFRRSVDEFTKRSQRSRGVLLAMEEAQSIFGGRKLDDQDIYVRWVKEGRKYGLGAILITQQPGAIAHELLSQADNFFVMHLLAQRDLDVLEAANAHFTGEVLDFIRDEPVKGNCYFWSAPDQPYVVGVRVDDYEKQAIAATTPSPSTRPATAPESYEDRLAKAIVSAICTEPRVFLYEVAKIDGRAVTDRLAVSPLYLALGIPDAEELQALRPDDWEVRWEKTALRTDVLEAALERVRLVLEPGRASGTVERREARGMLVLDEKRLMEVAKKLRLAVKGVRESGIELRSMV